MAKFRLIDAATNEQLGIVFEADWTLCDGYFVSAPDGTFMSVDRVHMAERGGVLNVYLVREGDED